MPLMFVTLFQNKAGRPVSDKRPRAGDQKYKYELRSGFGDVEQR